MPDPDPGAAGSPLSLNVRSLLSSRLARHSALNLGGAIIPILVAIPCLAVLPRLLQIEAFSLLLLAWALVGYAGILDLGLSRAVTLLLAREQHDEVAQREIVGTALAVALLSGIGGAVVIAAGAEWFVERIVKASPAMRDDAVQGFKLIAFTIPLLLPFLILQGFWDGKERFLEANVQRVIGGSLPIVGATLATIVRPDFTAAATGILIGRAISLTIALSRGGVIDHLRFASAGRRLRELLGYGGWIGVSSAISPIMGYLDRYILAYARGAAVVAYYAAPSELMLKLLVVPVAVTRSLYPKLAGSRDGTEAMRHLRQSYVLVLITCVPIAGLLLVLAPFVLRAWLGESYGTNSTGVLRLLALGFLFSALAQVPFTRLHAKGRPDLAAIVHLAEAMIFVPAVYFAAKWYGPVGCAGAWAARNFVDLIIFHEIGKRAAWR